MKGKKNSITLNVYHVNKGFESDDYGTYISSIDDTSNDVESFNKNYKTEKGKEERQKWNSGVEFLMSCIALSVGLGNVWRFPFTAYENGGGAFLIPYIIVLVLVGRPLYYLEMAIGQFSNKGNVKIWDVCPALLGVGYAQTIAACCILSYYLPLMAIAIYYLIASLSTELPWAKCNEEWSNCFDSSTGNSSRNQTFRSSSELYFLKSVLHEPDDIDNGIGCPDWKLSICLLISWTTIFLVLIKGVKSSGKVAYFLALFPYLVLLSLLVRGATLPGALDGIIFFVKPQWDQLLNPNVWYAAVTQAFFSLGVSVGAVVTYSSYNDFSHNIHRDAVIITILDTFTSLLAGCTIFSILGNLAYESGTEDVGSVVKGGTGLAFISYPDAIAKVQFVPQLFSILFFLMLYVLGIGSAISLQGSVTGVISDHFPNIRYWKIALTTSILGFGIGLVYVTPGGQYILNLVDYYGSSFILFILGSVEVIGFNWIYGMTQFSQDLEFMLKRKTGVYWRICWGLLTPLLLLIILVYSIVTISPLTYNDYVYPTSAYVAGTILMIIGLIQIPLWAVVTIYQRKYADESWWKTIRKNFSPNEDWGPTDPKIKTEWQHFKGMKKENIKNVDNMKLQTAKRIFHSKQDWK